MFRKSFEELLTKPVTRREFLSYLGVLLLSLVGVSALIKSITELASRTDPKKQTDSLLPNQLVKAGYGRSRYGDN